MTATPSIELAVPKLREGSYFPDWLLERRRRGRIGTCQRGRNLLSARRQHPQDGEAGRDFGHHPSVEVAGVRDDQRSRLADPAGLDQLLQTRRV